jgi:hypothetical protein
MPKAWLLPALRFYPQWLWANSSKKGDSKALDAVDGILSLWLNQGKGLLDWHHLVYQWPLSCHGALYSFCCHSLW